MSRFARILPSLALPLVILQSVFAQAPETISFQGFLTDSLTGTPINTDVATIQFKLYDGTTEVWTEPHFPVIVTEGVFNVTLGLGTPFDTLSFRRPYSLGIKVNSDNEIVPRTLLTSAPYALNLRGIRVHPSTTAGESPSIVGGNPANNADNVDGATISGGGTTNGFTGINKVTVNYGTIGGGYINTVTSMLGTVSGGNSNRAQGGTAATVGGGSVNIANGDRAVVSGGFRNNATNLYASVGGGSTNTAGGSRSTVGGGEQNSASGPFSTVSGGYLNRASGDSTSIAGGASNKASQLGAAIGGGTENTADGMWSAVGGGVRNTAKGSQSVVSGGVLNQAVGGHATVGGGSGNRAIGDGATIPGGAGNSARGHYSFAAGANARANHNGSFVWNDFSVIGGNDSLLSTGVNQFLVRAAGGVGIGTTSPNAQLHVVGNGPGSAAGMFEASGSEDTDVMLGGTTGKLESTGDLSLVSEDGVSMRLDDNNNNSLSRFSVSNGLGITVLRLSEAGDFALYDGGVSVSSYSSTLNQFTLTGSRNAGATYAGHAVRIENNSSATSTGPDVLALKTSKPTPGSDVNFITFFEGGGNSYGRIEGNGSNTGVAYLTTGADYAELLPRLDAGEMIDAGDVVGVFGGRITRATEGADRMMAISGRSAFVGNSPADSLVDGYETVAFVGQVPVKVVGPVSSGDYIVASGLGDGTAIAMPLLELRSHQVMQIVGRAWESSNDSGLKLINVEVGLDNSAAAVHTMESEMNELRTELQDLRQILAGTN